MQEKALGSFTSMIFLPIVGKGLEGMSCHETGHYLEVVCHLYRGVMTLYRLSSILIMRYILRNSDTNCEKDWILGAESFIHIFLYLSMLAQVITINLLDRY